MKIDDIKVGQKVYMWPVLKVAGKEFYTSGTVINVYDDSSVYVEMEILGEIMFSCFRKEEIFTSEEGVLNKMSLRDKEISIADEGIQAITIARINGKMTAKIVKSDYVIELSIPGVVSFKEVINRLRKECNC